jgi:hypothetical protein
LIVTTSADVNELVSIYCPEEFVVPLFRIDTAMSGFSFTEHTRVDATAGAFPELVFVEFTRGWPAGVGT